uniref:RING-type domain-containing protein n=1 Tax=Caenorhabditis tropicalis TaxID=1561998 RepID=A0A1I7UR48_9PELO
MSIVNTTECIICYNEYDTETRKPCIGTCGHSICEHCKHQMLTAKCPQCNRDEAFAITTINYQVLELIKHFKAMNTGQSSSDGSVLESAKGFDEGKCNECTLRSRKLRICITCAAKNGVLKNDEKKKEYVLNVLNNDVEAALEKAKNMAICGDCALDGVQHEGHKTMQLAVLKNSLDDHVPPTVEEKMKNMESSAKQVCTDLMDKFTNTLESLEKYFSKHDVLLTAAEKKIHFNNIEASLEKINDTVSLAKDACKRLEILNNEFEENTKIVETHQKAVTKAATVFATLDPVLVADRKQSPREPLLIGVFNPLDNAWTPVGRMPNPKSNYAVACNKTQIYIVGGMNNGTWLQSVEMYDRDKNLRRDCERMKRGRTRTSAGFHNSKLYVTGGYDSTYMKSVEIFDTVQGDWKDGPDLQKPRADAAVVSCNGVLFVLGGFNGKEYEENIEKLNDTTHKFEVFGEMQGSRAGFAACAFRGRIYIAGGWSNSSNTLRSVRSFDPLTKSWRDEPSLNKDRKYFTLHATSKTIYAIRGCADSWSLINEVEKFDPDRQKWDIISCSSPIPTQQNEQSA